jgi:hypothetical protein
MAQHKWAKEIKAWLDGETVLAKPVNQGFVQMEGVVGKISMFDNEDYTFCIMPKSKKPKYLYVYKDSAYTIETCSNPDNVIIKSKRLKELKHDYIGKIKLEVNDETN